MGFQLFLFHWLRLISETPSASHVYCAPTSLTGWLNSKESACNAKHPGSIPGSGRSPRGNGNPLQYSCLENSTDRGAWQATVHGFIESYRTEWLNTITNNTFLKVSLSVSPKIRWFKISAYKFSKCLQIHNHLPSSQRPPLSQGKYILLFINFIEKEIKKSKDLA